MEIINVSPACLTRTSYIELTYSPKMILLHCPPIRYRCQRRDIAIVATNLSLLVFSMDISVFQ